MSLEDEGRGSRTETMEQRRAIETRGLKLRVLSGDSAGAELDLPRGTAVIGTAADCDLRLHDRTVSSHHLRVEVTEQGIKVTDLESRNGTTFLGTRVREVLVEIGAVLALGGVRLSFSSRDPQPGEQVSDRVSYGAILGSSIAMRRIYALLERLEKFDYTTLINGETGVGKELFAREIHAHSFRKRGPYEVLDCGAVPANLFESELFGHVRGAFTGAQDHHVGVFERGNKGTVFLDEIGELPLELQPRLLRVLESREVRPVGGQETRGIDVRVIAATNRDLSREVKAGGFREDLYFRLNAVQISIPPLRARREDIRDLVSTLLRQLGQDDLAVSTETIELFTSGYDWPGNVRELRNAIMQVLSLGTLPSALAERTTSGEDKKGFVVDPSEPFLAARERLSNAFERDYLATQLRRAGGSFAEAARLSGMDRSYLRRLLLKHGLAPKKDGS